MSSDSDAFQSSFSLFSTPLPRLQQLSSLATPPSLQTDANPRSTPLRLNSPKSVGGFAIAAPPSSPPPTYARVVQRHHSQDRLDSASPSLEAVASAMSAGVQLAPQIARRIGPMIIPSVSDPPFPICWPATEPRLPSSVFEPNLVESHTPQSSFDRHSACSVTPPLSTTFQFFGSELWNPNPSQWGWSPWMPPDSSQNQQPLSYFGASAVNTLADSLIEPAVVLGSGDVLVPADALKQLMAASVSSRAGVALSVQRVGSSLLVNTLSSQDDVSFESVDRLSPFFLPNRAAKPCCLRCHLPKAICSCAHVSPRKSIGNGMSKTVTLDNSI
jgi:hypothetical protein